MVKGVATRKVAILVADGFDGQQLKELKASLKSAGTTPAVIGPRRTTVSSSDGSTSIYRHFFFPYHLTHLSLSQPKSQLILPSIT